VLAYDIGMHNGDDTAYYLAKGFRVVAVEAMPDFAAAARERFQADIDRGAAVIENVGIADSVGEMTFYINPENTVQSSFSPPAGSSWTPVRIPTAPLADIVRKHGHPDFLKIDIEHYDLEALKNLAAAGIIPKYISSEAHKVDILMQLYAMGYRRFRLVNGKWVAFTFGKVDIKRLTGQRTPYTFPKHSSGPFGDDVHAFPWMDIEGTMALWVNRVSILGRGWFDIHAALPAETPGMFMG